MLPNTMDPITQMFLDNRGQTLTIALINGFNVTIRAEMGKLSEELKKAKAERDKLRKQLGIAPENSATEESAGAPEQPEVS
ncbi:hypothetical protein ACLO87_09325 [Paenalcaligenes sp. Me52]|uniref:hypothetical protein n=1 Tax=Paenalcaligenes sp. Me52 TaxID=3392038 RepID=UPI003D283959